MLLHNWLNNRKQDAILTFILSLIISFAIMQLFLYLIVDNIITYDVNVYEKLSVYTNPNLLVLIEFCKALLVVYNNLAEGYCSSVEY